MDSNNILINKTQFIQSNDVEENTNIYMKGMRLTIMPTFSVNIIKLDVSYNNIKILPTTIGDLINLVHLDLGHNNIKIIPREIGKLVNLTYLNIEDNKIKIFPKEISKLIKLTTLILRGNKYK